MEYPLGEWPTWNMVVDCLERDPICIMKTFSWNIRTWDAYASELFIAFTNDLWLGVEPSRFRKHPVHASTLQEAVKSWTVSHVCETLLSVRFLPNSHGLNKKSKRNWDFSALLEVFFPEIESLRKDSGWRRFSQKNGYLHMYSEFKARLSVEQFHNVNKSLAELLSHTQCLPNSTKATDTAQGRVWTGFRGTIDMRTNSKFYMLKGIGSAKSKSMARKVMRINLPTHQVVTRLDEAQGIHEMASRKIQRREKRSGRSRNKRIPPSRREGVHDMD